IISAEDLAPFLRTAGVIVADLSQDAAYQAQHIPGAVHIDASRLASSHPPVMGLLPPQDVFAQLLSGAGITPDSYVVAYDSETGLKASRFLWTLDVIGHPRASLLDGGLAAWAGAGLPLEDKVNTAQSSEYPVTYGDEHCVD